MHQGKLSGVIELQSGDMFPAGCDLRFDQFWELPSVNEAIPASGSFWLPYPAAFYGISRAQPLPGSY
jgi:hypothetical protein